MQEGELQPFLEATLCLSIALIYYRACVFLQINVQDFYDLAYKLVIS